MSSHRDECQKALETVVEALATPGPIEGFGRHMLKATVEYGLEELAKIVEVKRVRRANDATPA
jgi:hypothetical protein